MADKQSDIPLIRRFRILGLHGYKDVEIDFKGPARIVIAENGSGKTTILSALYAFLTRKFDKLRSLSFNTIECEFSGAAKPLVIQRAHISESFTSKTDQLAELAAYGDVHPEEVARRILNFDDIDEQSIRSDHVLNLIYLQSPYSMEDSIEMFQAAREAHDKERSDELKALDVEIGKYIDRFDVLYLPTYRRVERSSGKRPTTESHGSTRIMRRPGRPPRGLAGGPGLIPGEEIRYGLSDVEERLADLLSRIESQSNIEYRRISAKIIDELLAGQLPYESAGSQPLPEIDALTRFFSRVGATFESENRVDDIKQFYNKGASVAPADQMLRYFLAKLSTVIDQTKVSEANIEKFVDKVNTYLTLSSDEKKLQYDARRMKVSVQNLWTQNEVKLDDLSSGEKQVVSLLAYLYLYRKEKIVLVDEPELSLSIDWQRRLLPDLLSSPTCKQLLAITHSPFIFENELDPYAGPLHITRHKPE